MKCWICDHVVGNIGCRGGDGCHLDGGGREGRQGGYNVGKVVTKEWRKAEVLKLEFFF